MAEVDKERNVALIKALKPGQIVDVTIQTWSSRRGYGARRYRHAEVDWVAPDVRPTYALATAITGRSVNRSRLWLDPHRIIELKETTNS